jgi:hypothetical protein
MTLNTPWYTLFVSFRFLLKNMSPNIRLLLACLFISPALHAQYDDLLRDPDIVWAAEYTTDFEMNPGDETEQFPRRFNTVDVVQFHNSGVENGLYGRKIFAQKYLSEQILLKMAREGFVCYKDSLLNTPMTQEELLQATVKIDTAYSSCEGGGQFHIIRNELDFFDLWCFRIRQVFWYDQKSKTFGSRILAFAPVVDIKDEEGNYKASRPVFWIKANDRSRKHLKDKDFNYIFQTKMRDNAPRLEDFEVLKGSFDFRKHFEQELRTPSRPCFEASEYKPADTATLIAGCFYVDTIISFHPKTNEEQISIEPRNCIETIEKVRFVQNWYYDERRGHLYTRVAGVAPLAAVRDSEGELRFYRPLFYQMYR